MMDIITKMLFDNRDLKYKKFNSKIINNIDSDKIIGVRVPVIRKIAKEIKDLEYIDDFLEELPHKYLEEDILHGILLSMRYKDLDILLERLDKFLLYVDNWAVTDIISPKLFKKYPDIVYEHIKKWVNSEYTYMVRFGIVTLLQFYLDKEFRVEELELINNITNDDYYVKMAISWFYSFALIKQYDYVIGYLENKKLDRWIHNKTISKCLDSYRISDENKEYLRGLKRGN